MKRAPPPPPGRVAVVGAGWAGLACAVALTQAGQAVTLYELAPRPGGRARTAASAQGPWLDNGQHILIGAYHATLALMQTVGVDTRQAFERMPLTLCDARGRGLRLPPGPPLLAFLRGVLAWQDLPWSERLGILGMALNWQMRGFRCTPDRSVRDLVPRCPPLAWTRLIEPLCVAALNTPASEASAQVLLRVMRDALFSGPGSADLLLPRQALDALLPAPATDWLRRHGATLHLAHRVQALQRGEDGGWRVDGSAVDGVVLACSAGEAARLAAPWAPSWAEAARAVTYQPIATVWIEAGAVTWPAPMIRLEGEPAQFAFDLGTLGGTPGLYALVASGARDALEGGSAALAQAALRQWQDQAGASGPARVHTVRVERRATFACTPGQQRPGALVAPGLHAAGDHVAGPYPATLEGAVLSGQAAAADWLASKSSRPVAQAVFAM